MTRGRGDQIVVKAKSDVFTGLLIAAFVVLALGVVAMNMQSNVVFGDALFLPSGNAMGR